MAKNKRVCSIENCDKPHYGHGYCNLHYQRERKGQEVDAPVVRAAPGEGIAFINDTIGAENWPKSVCIKWPFGLNAAGYPQGDYPGKSSTRINRIVCELAHGAPPSPDLEAAHSCGDRSCINPRHLRWATSADNIADKALHGTQLRGERHPMASMSEAMAREAVRRLASGESSGSIAKALGVSKASIGFIKQGRTWKWLQS